MEAPNEIQDSQSGLEKPKGKRGRKTIYKTKEEAKEAQKRQIREADERHRQQHRVYLQKVSNKQLRIVAILKKNAITDNKFIDDFLEAIIKRIDGEPSDTPAPAAEK